MQAPVVLILMHGPEPLIRPAHPTVAVPTSSQPAATSQTQIFAAAGMPSTGQPSQLQRFAAALGALPKQHRPQGRQLVLAFAACASTWLLALLGLSELLLWRLGQRSKQLQRLDGLYLEREEEHSAPHWMHRSYSSSLQVSQSARLEVLLHQSASAAAVTVTAGALCKQRCLPAPVPACGASAQPSSAAPVPSPHHLSPSPWRSMFFRYLVQTVSSTRAAGTQASSGCIPTLRQSQNKQLPCIAALQVQDLTPNIGMWWYFCAEMFPGPLPCFKACFHLGTVAMAGLITWRLPRIPVFVFLLHSIMLCFLKPYPSVADAALFMVKLSAAAAAQGC